MNDNTYVIGGAIRPVCDGIYRRHAKIIVVVDLRWLGGLLRILNYKKNYGKTS